MLQWFNNKIITILTNDKYDDLDNDNYDDNDNWPLTNDYHYDND